jgi:plasmid stabilization system protein ParE
MAWRVEFAPGAARDFRIILDHLTNVHVSLGEAADSAVVRAIDRVREIRSKADRLGLAPGVGASREDIGEGLRHVALDRAIYWFIADADACVVTVLAVFLAGEDHHGKMRVRPKGDIDKTRRRRLTDPGAT